MTDLIGRDALLAQVHASLDAGRDLITLCGPGGIGKTRLARAVLDTRPGLFIDASSLSTPGALVAAVATALDRAVPEDSDPAAAASRLAPALADRPGLVVLDDLEALVATVGPLIQAWRSAGAGPILVTSRLPLDAPGEILVPVPALPAPLARELFLSRADPATLDPTSEPDALSHLLDRLGGNPLALELAAGHTSLQGLAQIVASLDAGHDLHDLEGEHPGRHASLDRVVRESWALLPPGARDALRLLALARGPLEPDQLAQLDIDEASRRALGRASLLQVQPGGGLALLPEVRRWVRRHAPSDPATRQRFDAWLAGTVQPLQAAFHREDGAPARAALARRMPEVLRALETPDALPDTVFAVLVQAALVYLGIRHMSQAARLAERLSAALPRLPWAVRADVAERMVGALRRRGRQREALALVAAELEAARQAGEPVATAILEARHALLGLFLGRSGPALAPLERAVQTLEAHGEALAHARALRILGTALRMARRRDEAREVLTRAMEAAEALGNRSLQTVAAAHLLMTETEPARILALGERTLAASAGDDSLPELDVAVMSCMITSLLQVGAVDEATRLWPRHVALVRRGGDVESATHLHNRLVLARIVDQAPDEAERALAERLADSRRHQAVRWAPQLLLGQALVAFRSGRVAAVPDRVHEVREALRLQHTTALEPEVSALEALARAELGQGGPLPEDPVAAAAVRWQRGEGTRREVLEALAEDGPRDAVSGWIPAAVRSLLARHATWGFERTGAWFTLPDGSSVDFSRRRVARRLLAALVRHREARPGEALDADALIEAGWPGEQILPDAARTRLYAAIRDLRRQGLEPILETVGGGYRFSPEAAVEVVDPDVTAP